MQSHSPSPRCWTVASALALACLLPSSSAAQSGAKDKAPKTDEEKRVERILRKYPLHLPKEHYSYSDLPYVFGRGDNTPRHNPTTDAGATLGRVLFYDRRLSKNETISCASCHQQKHGFSDPRKFSVGFAGGRTRRNSMGLANARFHPSGKFFWDERAATLEDQVLMPIQDKLEMGMTLDAVVERLRQDPRYGDLMQRAFGDRRIDSDRISRALAQFVRSIVSYRSKFDKAFAKAESVEAEFPSFSKLENRGKAIFFRDGSCASCHTARERGPQRGAQRGQFGRGRFGGGRGGFGRGRGRGGRSRGQNSRAPAKLKLFVTPQLLNNGLDGKLETKDKGLGEQTGHKSDYGKFKVPSLRNIELTKPYMHDGRLATLRAVVDHYTRGIKDHPNLADRLRRRRNGGIITVKDRTALIAFLKTLTDHELVKDQRFSDPFRKR